MASPWLRIHHRADELIVLYGIAPIGTGRRKDRQAFAQTLAVALALATGRRVAAQDCQSNSKKIYSHLQFFHGATG
jgi:hypothetical protein